MAAAEPGVSDFTRRFWQAKIDWAMSGDVAPGGEWCVRAKGSHYMFDGNHPIVSRSTDTSIMLGFSGAWWYILFTDGPHAGRLRATNNLWHQGTIPTYAKEMLADNARFITKEEFFALVKDQVDMRYHQRTIDPRPHAGPFAD